MCPCACVDVFIWRTAACATIQKTCTLPSWSCTTRVFLIWFLFSFLLSFIWKRTRNTGAIKERLKNRYYRRLSLNIFAHWPRNWIIKCTVNIVYLYNTHALHKTQWKTSMHYTKVYVFNARIDTPHSICNFGHFYRWIAHFFCCWLFAGEPYVALVHLSTSHLISLWMRNKNKNIVRYHDECASVFRWTYFVRDCALCF